MKGLACHEITFFFLMKSKGKKMEITKESKTFNNEITERMEWLPIEKLAEYEAYPKFFADKLNDIKPYPEHIVTIK